MHKADVLHCTGLDGETKTVTRVFTESEDDKHGNMRATSVNVLIFSLFPNA